MSSDAAHTAMTDTSGDIATVTTPASLADAQDAIPGLLDDIVVTHVLRSEHFGDPADLARLPAVSRAMRDAVAATGLRFKELGEKRAAELGCFSALRQVAARVGNLEKLKLLRANGCPWNAQTCANAAGGGHLDVLQWARANGCPWDKWTCAFAAKGGHLEMLQWARANGCPWNAQTCANAAGGGHLDVLQWARANGCPWDKWTPRCVAVGARERLPVGHGYVHEGGGRRAPRCAAVGAVERRTVGRRYVRVCGEMRET
jgi:hypothetical protein